MIGVLSPTTDARVVAPAAFAAALKALDRRGSIVVLGHFDADGLAAIAILVRALRAAGWSAVPRIVGKGDSPWDGGGIAMPERPGGLIVCDLGTRAGAVLAGVPAIVIDHHVPTGTPDGTTISGHGLSPEPPSALIAWWCATALGDQADLLWLAALGVVGDMVEAAGFPELATAQARWGKTALRDATSLVNAPRRTAAADASAALSLLLTADGPSAIVKGDSAEARTLVAARAEVREAVEAARRVAPRVAGDVALIRFASPCQIHPLIAQQWRGRLKDKIVLAANTGYRDGWVHFAARSARGGNLIDFLADHRPPGADGRYGNGHAQATGGALRPADWNTFVTGLGFPDQQVPAP